MTILENNILTAGVGCFSGWSWRSFLGLLLVWASEVVLLIYKKYSLCFKGIRRNKRKKWSTKYLLKRWVLKYIYKWVKWGVSKYDGQLDILCFLLLLATRTERWLFKNLSSKYFINLIILRILLFTLVLVVHDWWFIFFLYFSYFSILTDSFWIYNMNELLKVQLFFMNIIPHLKQAITHVIQFFFVSFANIERCKN